MLPLFGAGSGSKVPPGPLSSSSFSEEDSSFTSYSEMQPRPLPINPQAVDPKTGIITDPQFLAESNQPNSDLRPVTSDLQPPTSDLRPEPVLESSMEGVVTSGDLELSLSKVSPFKRPRSQSHDKDNIINEEPSVQVGMCGMCSMQCPYKHFFIESTAWEESFRHFWAAQFI